MPLEEELKRLNHKIDINHDVHIRNEETLKNILEQTKKTNGRVTSLEEVTVRLDKGNALLHQIVSQQHRQYEKYVIQQEKLHENQERGRENDPMRKLGYDIVKYVLFGVLGAGLVLILK